MLGLTLFQDGASGDIAYIEKKIDGLPDIEKLKTLNQLMNNHEISFRSGNFVNIYTVLPNKILTDFNKIGYSGGPSQFFMTKMLSVYTIGKNEYYVQDRSNSTKWKRHYLPDDNFFTYNLENRDDFTSKIVLLGSLKSSNKAYMILDPSGYRISSIDSAIKQKVSDTFIPFTSNTFINFENSFDDSLLILRYNTDCNCLQSQQKTGLKDHANQITFITATGNGQFAVLTNNPQNETKLFTLSNNSNTTELLDVTPTVLVKEKFQATRSSYLRNILIFIGVQNNQLKLYQLSEHGKKLNIDSTIKIPVSKAMFGVPVIPGFKTENELWLISIGDRSSIDNLLHITVDEGKVKYKFIPAPKISQYKDVINFNENALTVFTFNEEVGSYSQLSIKNDSIIPASKSDSEFIRNISNATISSPIYSPTPEFVASYFNDMALVHIKKNQAGRYEYDFIDKISWPDEPFDVRKSFDVFFVAISITLIATIYALGFIFFRVRFPKNTIDYNYDGTEVFKSIPLLRTKLKEVQNIAQNLKIRSDVMLSLGILFGVGGVLASVIVFQLMEDKITNTWQDPHVVIGLLKPAILLVFVETFTFFFLKQYRIIFNEYKLFYSVFLRYLNYFHLLEFNPDIRINPDLIKQINDLFLTEKIDMYESGTRTQINEFDNATWLKILETIGNIQSKSGGKTS